MRLADALEMSYLDVLEGTEDGREEARYVPHMRSRERCAGCGTIVSSERACNYCGSDGGAWY